MTIKETLEKQKGKFMRVIGKEKRTVLPEGHFFSSFTAKDIDFVDALIAFTEAQRELIKSIVQEVEGMKGPNDSYLSEEYYCCLNEVIQKLKEAIQ